MASAYSIKAECKLYSTVLLVYTETVWKYPGANILLIYCHKKVMIVLNVFPRDGGLKLRGRSQAWDQPSLDVSRLSLHHRHFSTGQPLL